MTRLLDDMHKDPFVVKYDPFKHIEIDPPPKPDLPKMTFSSPEKYYVHQYTVLSSILLSLKTVGMENTALYSSLHYLTDTIEGMFTELRKVPSAEQRNFLDRERAVCLETLEAAQTRLRDGDTSPGVKNDIMFSKICRDWAVSAMSYISED